MRDPDNLHVLAMMIDIDTAVVELLRSDRCAIQPSQRFFGMGGAGRQGQQGKQNP
jgi:hypothetical protein